MVHVLTNSSWSDETPDGLIPVIAKTITAM